MRTELRLSLLFAVVMVFAPLLAAAGQTPSNDPNVITCRVIEAHAGMNPASSRSCSIRRRGKIRRGSERSFENILANRPRCKSAIRRALASTYFG